MATPPLLLLMAWGAWAVGAPFALTASLAALAALLGYVVVFDFPLAIDIDGDGVRRACLLRRRLTSWDEVAGIVRSRKRGLVMVTKDRKRRILLDRSLDDAESGRLRDLAQSRDVEFEA